MAEMENVRLLLYIYEDIQPKLLISKSKCNIETLSVAVSLRKRKWFLNCSYNHHQNSISNHLECLNRLIDEHSSSFDNFIFIGDFNVSTNHNSIINICDLNGLRNLINVPTFYKHFGNPTSIDLILMNRPSYFQRSIVFKTGLSDFHLHGGPQKCPYFSLAITYKNNETFKIFSPRILEIYRILLV